MTESLQLITPTLPYAVERAALSDLGAIHQLEKICFPLDAWPWIELAATMSLPGIIRYKALWNGELVGFVAGEKERHKHTGWIATVAVHPDYRGRGIGSVLMDMCEQTIQMPRVRLTVREFNETAIRLYGRNGYKVVARWPHYYSGGIAGVVMEKNIRAAHEIN